MMNDCMATFKESILILLFEFLGTAFLTALFSSCYAAGDPTGLLCGFFILLIFSARISGSHFNPAITLAFMFRRDTGRFSRKLGLLYILAQYLGSLIGALFCFNLFETKDDKFFPLSVLPRVDDDGEAHWLTIQAMFVEVIGTMLITFLYLTQTEEKTKMSSDPAITTLIISATYVAIVSYGETSAVQTGSPYNPAAAFGIFMGMAFDGDVSKTEGVWIFLFFAYAGAMLAIVLFEFVYKKAVSVVEDQDQGSSDDERSDHDALLPTAMGDH